MHWRKMGMTEICKRRKFIEIAQKIDLCRSLNEKMFSWVRLSVRLLIEKLNLIMIVLGSTISLCHVTPVAPGGQTINHTSTP